jgi:hypothetical protein
MFDQRRVSQERVIGISFVDILIQAVFVLLVALFVGYVDPEIQLKLDSDAKFGKDLCHKLNKDSIEACREFIEDKQVTVKPNEEPDFHAIGQEICKTLGATEIDDCRVTAERYLSRLASLRPCLKPLNEFSVPTTLRFDLKSPNEIQFIEFSNVFISKLETDRDTTRLALVEEIQKTKGKIFNPDQINSVFGFIRESTCYHRIDAPRSGRYSNADLKDALSATQRLREPLSK